MWQTFVWNKLFKYVMFIFTPAEDNYSKPLLGTQIENISRTPLTAEFPKHFEQTFNISNKRVLPPTSNETYSLQDF